MTADTNAAVPKGEDAPSMERLPLSISAKPDKTLQCQKAKTRRQWGRFSSRPSLWLIKKHHSAVTAKTHRQWERLPLSNAMTADKNATVPKG